MAVVMSDAAMATSDAVAAGGAAGVGAGEGGSHSLDCTTETSVSCSVLYIGVLLKQSDTSLRV
ncbi:unnamed protein product [Cuscuta epithymum]|uniref:Uncharacterized protein n=1 Tax=Cuscuta epithymum TaxID=186058 RepID=A0AAV0D9D5_9ASTE|nr:unnamed protein product [Cuscuta epithymum]